MDINEATAALGALAQETRLAAFRLLVRSGSSGLPAGEIAQSLGIPHNTMSTHLGILCHSGLVGSRRAGRSVIYSVDFAGTRSLLRYLLEDCCLGSPDACTPILDSVLTACCSDTQLEKEI
jgi:DNA-binding transcriptional ArsR family regulator